MNTRCLLLVSILLLQTGCLARKARLANFQSGEVLRATFTDILGTSGKIKVTMPNGEVLKGPYSAIRGHDEVAFTFSSANVAAVANTHTDVQGGARGALGNTPFQSQTYGSIDASTQLTGAASGYQQTRTMGGTGRAYALLSSTTPGSKLMMEVIVTYGVLSGHGWGEARTNDGRTYTVTF